MELRRRRFLQISAGAVSASALFGLVGATPSWAGTDFALARTRRTEILNGGVLDTADQEIAAAIQALDAEAQSFWSTMDTSAARSYLWSDYASFNSPEQANNSLARLRSMAIAWSAPSSSLRNNPALLADILSALDFWGSKYTKNSPARGNWWFWEIGMPNLLADLGLLLFSQLTTEQKNSIDSFIGKFVVNPNVRTNSPALKETGANRTDKAHIVIRHGLLIEDSARIASGRDALSDLADNGKNSVFGYVTSGDGFYADGSFVQHAKLAYVGSYGLVTIDGLADILTLLAGTTWAVTDDKVRIIYDAALRHYGWFVFDGQFVDAVRGRAVSRRENTGQTAGQTLAGALVQLAGSSAEYAPGIHTMVKGWLSRNTSVSPLTGNTLNRFRQLKELLGDSSVTPGAALQRHVQTPDQDRVIHHQGTWTASFSISSNRMGRYEWGNGENNTGWYHGDGMLQILTSDDRRCFDQNYWATSDPYHLPGVTNGLQTRENGAVSGTGIPSASQTWAGGVGWLDRFGAVGMDHKAYDGDLVAKKSWFCLADVVIALGSGISSSQGQTVHTTVEARKLQPGSSQPLTVDGVQRARTLGQKEALRAPSWAHLPAVGGYLFLQPQSVTVLRESRTASWRQVNVNGPTEQVTDDYQSVYFDHGNNPSGANYAYALLPGASAAQTQSRSMARGFSVVANTAAVQAIAAVEGNLTLANFFVAGTSGGITVDRAASVVVGEDQNQWGGTDLVVTVADPARHNQPIALSIDRAGGTILEYGEKATVSSSSGKISLTVPTSGTRGHEQLFRFGPVGRTVKHNTTGAGQNQWNYSTGWTVGSLDSYSTSTGSTATLRFTGSRIYLQAAPGPSQGLIRISVDGVQPRTVDLFALVRNGVKVVAAFGDLDPKRPHTLVITCTGTKNAQATMAAAAISGAVIVV